MKASRFFSVLAASILLVAGSTTAIRAAVTSIPALEEWEKKWHPYLQYESAAVAPTPIPIRHTRINCERSALLIWPDNTPLPTTSHLPLAYAGEEVDIVSDVRYSIGGTAYYETGFPILGKSNPHNRHYWIAATCLNLGRGKRH